MATTGVFQARSFLAGEDLSAAKWRFLTLESDGKVDVADADAEEVIGVAMTNPSAEDRAVAVAISGEVKVYAGGNITVGDDVVTDANGAAVERSTSSSATAVTAGKALASAVSGDVVTILLVQGGKITDES